MSKEQNKNDEQLQTLPPEQNQTDAPSIKKLSKATTSLARANLLLVSFIASVLLIACLKIGASVILPILIAIFLSFVLEPPVRFFQKYKIPRIVAILTVILIMLIVLGIVSIILYNSIRSIANNLGFYEKRSMEIYKLAASVFNLPFDEHLSFFDNVWNQANVRKTVQDLILSFSGSFISNTVKLVTILIITIFLMMEASFLQKKLEVALADNFSIDIQKIASNIITSITRYLSIKFFVSLATGLLVWLFLALLKLDFAVIWGVLSFILNFIPTFGSIAAGASVIGFALLQFWPSPMPVIWAAIIMISINMVIGNIIEPHVQGQNLGLSTFVVLTSLLVWGWIWGFAGLVLSVPMTVIIKIICEEIPGLRPIAIIMSTHKEVSNSR
ncbi:MAG TPA: AI-2E family transporter [Spirochaetia bacterium]|nr:AI-2E family transporter [Spirochaetales bacterium]HRS66149.1 AI-2E family transporter [Spirochaetia bacterium]HPD80547.1 AI-2E family transporter [Spirochaetales bacterium]HQG39691.1 AI-2E family transporter [Spirochaetales bacterium]HQK34290.1 AI-2E family transporter [Spirochaetales bacterium]